jgi:alpha-1,6-mannosyltransferase
MSGTTGSQDVGDKLATPSARPTPPTAAPDRFARFLAWSGVAGIVIALLIMVAASAARNTWEHPYIVLPSGGFPWGLSAHRTLLAEVTVAMWAAALLGGAGVAAGLAALSRGARPPVRLLLAVGLVAAAAFTVMPPAGSTDALDYAAYGRMVVLGHNPYEMTPKQLRLSGDPIGKTAPHSWQATHSDYGPLASLEQATAAELGGNSTARIVLWLKLWNALAFGLVIIAIDRVLRADPARRARAHLLWSLNPLLLWGLVASGHLDTVAAACGLLGLLLVKPWRRGEEPHVGQFLAAGALTGAAADLKITYALFGLGLAWAARWSLGALFAAASGALAILVPSYLWFGRRALTVLMNHRDATTDNLYRLFAHSFLRPSLAEVDLVIVPVLVILAVLLLWRLPDRLPELPTVMPAFALSLAWMLAWPYQRPWYDAAVACLLVLYPASRLDWVILGQLAVGTVEFMPGMPSFPPRHSWLGQALDVQSNFVMPLVRLAALLAVAALCVTGAWYARDRGPAPGQLARV